MLNCIAPFFIVDDLQLSLDFYRSKLGFESPTPAEQTEKAEITLESFNVMEQ